jgi:hypothetical protein
MNRAIALVLTPLFFVSMAGAALALAVGAVFFFAFNPLALFGLVGAAAVIALSIVLLFVLTALSMVFAAIYYVLRDINEPPQRSSGRGYSLEQQQEVGKKEQAV